MRSKKMMLSSVVLMLLLPVICTSILSGQTEGKKVFGKVIAALGGAEKIKNIKNFLLKVEITRKIPRGEFQFNAVVVIQFPDKILYTLRSSKGHVIMAVDGTEAWQRLPPKSMEPMSDQDRKYEMTLILRDPFYIAQNLHQYKIEYMGEKDCAGIKAIDLFITGPSDFHLFIDPKTYLPVGDSYHGVLPTGPDPVEQREFYSDYKETDGIKYSRYVTLEAGDNDLMKGTTVDIKFNIPVERDLFKGKNIPQEYMDFINLKNLKNRGQANQVREKQEKNANENHQ
jgi:hypothetical protein